MVSVHGLWVIRLGGDLGKLLMKILGRLAACAQSSSLLLRSYRDWMMSKYAQVWERRPRVSYRGDGLGQARLDSDEGYTYAHSTQHKSQDAHKPLPTSITVKVNFALQKRKSCCPNTAADNSLVHPVS